MNHCILPSDIIAFISWCQTVNISVFLEFWYNIELKQGRKATWTYQYLMLRVMWKLCILKSIFKVLYRIMYICKYLVHDHLFKLLITVHSIHKYGLTSSWFYCNNSLLHLMIITVLSKALGIHYPCPSTL